MCSSDLPADDEDWYYSEVRAWTQFRNEETKTEPLAVIAEAGSMSPQLLLQLTPLSWGLGFNVGGYHLAWKFGPLAIKISWAPMSWRAKRQMGNG